MSLRWKFGLYLFVIHALFAAGAIFALWENRAYLVGVEIFLIGSFIIAISLVRRLFAPIHLMQAGADLLAEEDFGSRFVPVGQPEVDRLVDVYNGMVDRLREERIHSEEQHYFLDRVLHESPLGIVTFDFDGCVEMVNPSAERMLQGNAEDLKGKRLTDLNSALAQTLQELPVGEARLVPFGGQRRLRCQRAHFLDRGFERQFVLMEELTEALRQSEKRAYEHLIRMMSHEVNNTVGAVNSLLQSCLNYRNQLADDDREDYETALRVAVDRTDHLNGFMKGFADVVRLPDPDRRPCDVKQLLEDIAVLLGPECAKRRIEWVWDISGTLDDISADKNQLEQVFVNVLKNAMEAIGEVGQITVHVGDGFVTVEDTGEGISEEIQDTLFAPFFSTKREGQGIGLTLVQEVLTRHGFDFDLKGPPGGPTTFTMWF